MRAEPFRDPEGWELPLLRSPAIPAGFRHGFTTRLGGVSRPPFDSLNLGRKWGDAGEDVAENWRRVARAAGGADGFYVASQVHGAAIAGVAADDRPPDLARVPADGLCCDRSRVAVAVFVADCVPALLADARTGAFAAVHAGWRGTVAGVLPAAVRALGERFGARPADLRVALGPAIGACCFEVGPEVVEAVERAVPGARAAGVIIPAPDGLAGKAHVDLKAANRLLLEGAGVPADAIDAGPECTSCESARFFSFRRDGGHTGQQLAFIARSVT